MATQSPTTYALSQNIVSAIEAQLGQSVPLLPKAFIRVLAKAVAGVQVILYRYIGFMGLQMLVRLASGSPTDINGVQVTPLIEWGRLIGLGDPTPATSAELTIQVTITNQVGSLPSGSQLLGATNGVTYLTIGAVLLNAATVNVKVRAVAEQDGVIGNLDAGAVLNFANPLANVARSATVVSQDVTGADAETIDAYRARVIDRFQRRPQGGAYADYAIWGGGVSGVANIYPYTGAPGQVNVYVESATELYGIPTQAQLNAVFDAIEFDQNGLASRRPANAYVNVLPITRTAFDVRVAGVTGNDLGELYADITAAVQDYFNRAEPYIVGLDSPPSTDRITAIELLGRVNDVVKAAGGQFSSATFYQAGGSNNLTVYTLGEGEKARAATVSFI